MRSSQLPQILLLTLTLCVRSIAQVESFSEELPVDFSEDQIEEGLPAWAFTCFEIELYERVGFYLQNNVSLKDWEELFRVEGVTIEHIICLHENFGPIVQNKIRFSEDQFNIRIRHDIRPVDETRKPGVDQYGRIQYARNNSQWFVQWETDRDEWATIQGVRPDFISGHGMIKSRNGRFKLTLGDFRLSHGQGLIAYAGLFASPGAGTGALIRTHNTAGGYRSKTESGFYRGISIESHSKKNNLNTLGVWVSNAPLDASLKINENREYWQSLDLSGQHATASQRQKKGSLKWRSVGMYKSFQLRKIHVTTTFRNDKYSAPFFPGSEYFRAGLPEYDNQYTGILSHHGNWGPVALWGEMAFQSTGGKALIQGLSVPLGNSWELAGIARWANPSFHAPLSGAFFKRSPPRNELGGYLSIAGPISTKMRMQIYWNHWQFKGVRYLHDRPGKGARLVANLEYKVRKVLKMNLQTLVERDEQRLSDAGRDPASRYKELLRTRLHLEYLKSRNFKYRARVELSANPRSATRSAGILHYWDVIFKPLMSAFRLNARVTWTQIPDYNLRISAFENDVLGRFRITAFSSNALHFSFSTRYKFNANLTIDLNNRVSIESGNLNASKVWNHSIQLQYRLAKD